MKKNLWIYSDLTHSLSKVKVILTNYKALLKNDMNAYQFHVSAVEVCPICHQTLNPAILICLESLLCGKTKDFGPLARVFAMKLRAHALTASFVCSRV